MIEELKKKPSAFPPYEANKCFGKRAFGMNFILYYSGLDKYGKNKWLNDDKYGFKYHNLEQKLWGGRIRKPEQDMMDLNYRLVNAATPEENERMVKEVYYETVEMFLDKMIRKVFEEFTVYPDDVGIVDKLFIKGFYGFYSVRLPIDTVVKQLTQNFKYFKYNKDSESPKMRRLVEEIVNGLKDLGAPTRKEEQAREEEQARMLEEYYPNTYYLSYKDEQKVFRSRQEKAKKVLRKRVQSGKFQDKLKRVKSKIQAKKLMNISRKIKQNNSLRKLVRSKVAKLRKKNDVEFVGKLSAEQQLMKRLEDAIKKGEVIDLT